MYRMARIRGNTQLKAARQHAGYASQQALADALTDAAPRIGLGRMDVSARQVRRWESSSPPWPRTDHQRLLVHVLQQPIEQLGFIPPWETTAHPGATAGPPQRDRPRSAVTRAALPLPVATTGVQPPTLAADFATVTVAHRRLYWSVRPTQLHPAVVEHTRLGTHLLAETSGVTRRLLAAALAESLLLAGRIEFFDIRRPAEADETLVHSLQAAAEADDPLLGSAILAHAAFIPGWDGRRDEAAERIRAARTYARRAPASAEFLAWLDAVEAECETRCDRPREGLRLISHAEGLLKDGTPHSSPEWFDWFSPTRLAAFKGNTQLNAGHLAQAHETLVAVLNALPDNAGKQRTVILGDLAAVEAARKNPEAACAYAVEAMDQLAITWYATGMDRIVDVRRALQPWADSDEVRDLDDRIYGWQTTLRALRR